MALHWKFDPFDALTPAELYAIMRLRNEVFAVEQNCVYLDADNRDQAAFHITGWDGTHLAAYCRILPRGVAYEEPSIGRVATALVSRRHGHGRQMMQLAIAFTLEQFTCDRITISAQQYLERFYGSFGFVRISEVYDEDGIPHIRMQLKA